MNVISKITSLRKSIYAQTLRKSIWISSLLLCVISYPAQAQTTDEALYMHADSILTILDQESYIPINTYTVTDVYDLIFDDYFLYVGDAELKYQTHLKNYVQSVLDTGKLSDPFNFTDWTLERLIEFYDKGRGNQNSFDLSNNNPSAYAMHLFRELMMSEEMPIAQSQYYLDERLRWREVVLREDVVDDARRNSGVHESIEPHVLSLVDDIFTLALDDDDYMAHQDLTHPGGYVEQKRMPRWTLPNMPQMANQMARAFIAQDDKNYAALIALEDLGNAIQQGGRFPIDGANSVPLPNLTMDKIVSYILQGYNAEYP